MMVIKTKHVAAVLM